MSASARSIAANAAVLSARLSWRSVATCWAIWFQVFQIGAELQNFPATVWSGVRTVLESRPTVRTSSSAATYAGLSTAGGAAGRNCCAPSARTA